MQNLNLLFYKTFYSKLGDNSWFDEKKKITVFENDISNKSSKLVDVVFYKENYDPFCETIAPNKFMLKTAYPGLLVGTGYAHGVESENDVKVGFSFDFVTGQPYIPGSSIKGLLRSYFEHPEVIRGLLGIDLTDKEVKTLMLDIFEDNADSSADTDIFFDAIVRCGDTNGHVIGFDSITPHREETKNPVPIKIIKILPDVVFEFSFSFRDSRINNDEQKTVTAAQKLKLFQDILMHFGVGAKTNVGYGVLTSFEKSELDAYKWPEKNAGFSGVRPSIVTPNDNNNRAAQTQTVGFVKDRIYEAEVNGGNANKIFIKIKGKNCRSYIYRNRVQVELADGDKIQVSFYQEDKYGCYCFNYKGEI